MRKLVVGAFVTADGVMQAPGGPDEDRDGRFEYGGWSVNYWDDFMGQVMDEQLHRAEAMLLGRKTYEIFAAHWPRVGGDDPFAAKLNGMPKYVASRTLGEVAWNNSHLLKGDVAEAVAQLKAQAGGEIHVNGSSNLIQTLLRHDLVDELMLWVFPVLVGGGKLLFGEGVRPGALKLADTKTSSTGVVIQTYECAGDLQCGSFAVDEEHVSQELWDKERPRSESSLKA